MQLPQAPGAPAPKPAAPAGMGPATMPQGNQGNQVAAMQMVQNAVKMLEQALPMIPMGSPMHEKIHKVALDLSKEIGQGKENPALQIQSLIQMMRQAGQQQPMSALSKMAAPTPTTPPATAAAPEPTEGA